MNHADQIRLEEAVQLLENPGLVAKLADKVGQPIGWMMKRRTLHRPRARA